MSGHGNEIKRLTDDSIRRIVAEQAITDLASIVKELVDNALDAESSTIKSTFPNQPFPMCRELSLSHTHTTNISLLLFLSNQFVYSARDLISLKFRMTGSGSLRSLDHTLPRDMQHPRFRALRIFIRGLG